MDMQLTFPFIIALGAGAVLLGAVSVFGIRKIVMMGQFAYHNARLSTIGNPYVSREELTPLVEVSDPSSLIKTLQGDLAPEEEMKNFREADRRVMSRFHASFDQLLRDSPKVVKPLVKAYMEFWEMEELKRLLRLVGRRSEPLYPVGYLDPELETQFLGSSSLVQAVELLEGHSVNMVIAPLIKESGAGLEDLDSVLDRYVLDTIFDLEGLPRSCRKGTRAFSNILADRYNIQLMVRSKMNGWTREQVLTQVFTGGGTIGLPLLEQMSDSSNLREALSVLNGTHLERFFKDVVEKGPTAVEIALDQMLLDGSISLSHSFGMNIGPTIRYMAGKEMEMKNLRTLLQGAFAGWSPEKTRASLVLQGGAL
ncbi:MAG: V-type ATPase subunit [Candidatus Thermoplasmatota archaeon]|nr:V-type ATPase subunit [Candidatus Thermoplasmatota archaeon]